MCNNRNSFSEIYEDIFKIYLPTYLHLVPYVVGIIAGYLLVHMKQNNFKFNKYINVLFWIISIVLIFSVIASAYFFTNYTQVSLLKKSLYAGFHRLIWSICVSFLIISCEIGQGGVVAKFFRSKMFVPLSKLCYLVYLTHYVVTWARFAYIRQPLVYSCATMVSKILSCQIS